MNYSIKVIPNSAQRYETVGDYWLKHAQQTEIRVSDMSDGLTLEEHGTLGSNAVAKAESFELLIAVHELVEAYLTRRDGIDYSVIDRYDFTFHGGGEPGEASDCPYQAQHFVASEIEKKLADLIGVSWNEYEAAITKMSQIEQESEAS